MTIEAKGILFGVVAPFEIEAVLRSGGYETTSYRDASAEHVSVRIERPRGGLVGSLWIHGPATSSAMHGDTYAGRRTLIAGSEKLGPCISFLVDEYGGFFAPAGTDVVFGFREGVRHFGLDARTRLWILLRRTLPGPEADRLAEAAVRDTEYAAAIARLLGEVGIPDPADHIHEAL